jgi:hypothetical protein
MYWVGMNVTGASAQELDAFNRHYNEVHAPEVLALEPGPALVHRYRLVDPDPRGRLGPDWLCVYEFADTTAADAYLTRQWGPLAGRPSFTPGPPVWTEKKETVWRILWHRVATRGEPSGMPELLRMVGMDPVADHTAAELDAFNEHYTNVHLAEAMASVPYGHGSRHVLGEGFEPQPASTPRYCAVYEAAAAELDDVRTALATNGTRPPNPAEPRAWRERRVQWRLSYERVPM